MNENKEWIKEGKVFFVFSVVPIIFFIWAFFQTNPLEKQFNILYYLLLSVILIFIFIVNLKINIKQRRIYYILGNSFYIIDVILFNLILLLK